MSISEADFSQVWMFFPDLTAAERKELRPIFHYHQLAPAERLIQQGERGDRLYVVVHGRLRIIDEELERDENILTYKNPGEMVGEIGLLTGEKRTASVDAVVATELLGLHRADLDVLAESNPGLRRRIDAVLLNHVRKSRLNHVMVKANLFNGLAEEIFQEIRTELQLVTVSGGETIMRAGDPGDALYIVIGGRLRIVSGPERGERPYTIDTRRGQTVGEIGLLTGAPRTATVYALRDSLLAVLTRDSFSRLLQKYPDAMLTHFAGPILSRLQGQISGTAPPPQQVSTICLLPISSDLPLDEFAQDLTSAIGRIGPARKLNGEICAAQLGMPNLARLEEEDSQAERLLFWLNEQEAAHDFVVYQADHEPTAWTKRCIRQADLLLFVGAAAADPRLSPLENSLHELLEHVDRLRCLVLLHEQAVPLPQQSASWAGRRQVRDLYHCRRSRQEDFMRLARLLTGRGVGVVLSGGGARAMAQIGVLRALVEQQIPVDAICGVSAGAIFAALFAMQLDFPEFLTRVEQSIYGVDFTLPLHALTTGHNWTKAMKFLFWDVKIEDLWLPFFCLSADLTLGKPFVHDHGSLMHAVRASTAIPGLLTPVYHEGSMLVDGGVINNLPADLMEARPDIRWLIAVDVAQSDKNEKLPPFDYQISGWRSLWHRLHPRRQQPPVPSIGDVLMRSITITNEQILDQRKGVVDLYFAPSVAEYGLLDFGKLQELEALGYRDAKAQLADGHDFLNQVAGRSGRLS